LEEQIDVDPSDRTQQGNRRGRHIVAVSVQRTRGTPELEQEKGRTLVESEKSTFDAIPGDLAKLLTGASSEFEALLGLGLAYAA
jgi:hypothetical protein